MAQQVERVKPTEIFYGQTNVAATATVLGASGDLVASEVTIKAMSGNVNSLWLGDSSVATGTGFELKAGQQITVTAGSPSDLYLIATSANDDVSWIAT
jgi:hypothetical protein